MIEKLPLTKKMEKWCFLVVLFVLMFGPWVNGGMAMAYRSQDGTEEWGYVEVRPSKQNAL